MQGAPIPEDNSSQWPTHGPAESTSEHDSLATRIKTELEITSLLERRIKDWGESQAVAQENLEWFQENALSLVHAQSQSNDSTTVALFDLFGAFINPPVTAPMQYLLRFYLWRCEMPLADSLINYETPAHWWREMGISKQMCFKLANEFCDFMNLPRRSNQRDAKSRKKMAEKRLAPKKK